MEEQQPTGHVVKGKDLPGAINVLPAGLGEVLKKRESREFKMEQTSSGMTFSTGTKSGGEIQQTFSSSKNAKESSSSFSSSMISAPGTLQQQQFASGMSSSSMQQQKTTSSSFSSSTASSQQQQVQIQGQATPQQRVLQHQPQPQAQITHGEEIKQESLKTTIQSAITDLEQDIDKTVVDSGDKENQAPPPIQQQVISENSEYGSETMKQHNGHTFEEYKHGSEFDKKLKWPREFKGRPDSMHDLEEYVPSSANLIGVPDFSELDGSGKMTEQFSMQQSKEQTMNTQTVTSSTFNGHVQQESQQQSFLSTSASNNPLLEKVLAPAGDADYDSNSLKRRNPRQMFTDSAFYSPKFHPSVADQVEMAHQLSSSLYTDGNKMSKGQEMYLKRAKTSGEASDLEAMIPQPDKPLNLKLVMNPEGKTHDWTDLPDEEIPELQQIATGGGNPETARQMVENLQSCKGRGGELFAKRRKKADKWVVDEGSQKSNPSQLADQFVQQQSFQQEQQTFQQEQKTFQKEQKTFQQEQYQETEINHTTEVVDSGVEERQRLQEDFHQQQLLKQQQGFEMRQERQSNAVVQGGPADNTELPPNFTPCSLKGRPFTPTFDLSCHNTQGIDVWAIKGPKPFGKSGTLSRTTINQATMSGELPPQPAKPKQQAPAAALDVPQVAICPATPAVNEVDQSQLIVSSHQQSSSSAVSSSSVTTVQGGVSSIDLEEQKRKEYEQWFKTQEREQQALEYDCSVKYEATTTSTNVLEAQTVQQNTFQEVATHTQIAQNKDEVDRAKQAAEEQQRLEQEKREKEMREEQQRLEQLKREQEMKEQQIREQQQREQALLEQQLQEQKLREQEALEQQRKEQERREQEIREQQILEQQNREQEAREQQIREQQFKEQQMREQQMHEQQMKEQQIREQQIMEQQMREQQMREQQMREQQMREQQMREQQIQQQQMQQKQMSMSSTTTETSSMTQQHSLHQSGLSMQVKSGGFLSGSESQQADDYTGSLRPTTTGELIRTQGDVQYTQASMEQSQMEQVQLRKTSGSKDVKDTIRQSGIFVGIAGDHNALVAEMANFDYEKHSVTDLVKHFSKSRPGDIPEQMMPQHYQMQHAPPSLTQLQEQAKDRQFSYQQRDQVDGTSELSMAEQKAAEEKARLFERRTSLKDFLFLEGEKAQQANQLIDPSNILQVDGSVEGKKLYNGTRRTSSGRELDSQGRLIDTDKWDNHNAIARGWRDVEDNYHPVTFRKIYGVNKQAPTPVPMMKQATPVAATTPVTSQQETSSEVLEASDL